MLCTLYTVSITVLPSVFISDSGDDEESRKVKLEKGDYIIHVHIIEARDLKPRDAGDTSDPVCEVTVMGVKKSTQIHKEFGANIPISHIPYIYIQYPIFTCYFHGDMA